MHNKIFSFYIKRFITQLLRYAIHLISAKSICSSILDEPLIITLIYDKNSK